MTPRIGQKIPLIFPVKVIKLQNKQLKNETHRPDRLNVMRTINILKYNCNIVLICEYICQPLDTLKIHQWNKFYFPQMRV